MFSGEVLTPAEERVKLSLAEQALFERLQALLIKMLYVLSDSREALEDLFRGRLGALRGRIVKGRGTCMELREEIRNVATYVARISPALVASPYYIRVVDSVKALLDPLENIYLVLEAIGNGVELPSERVLILERGLESSANVVKGLAEVFRRYVESPSKVGELMISLSSAVKELQHYYVEASGKLLSPSLNLSQYILVNSVLSVLKSVDVLYEAILCLHTVRRP